VAAAGRGAAARLRLGPVIQLAGVRARVEMREQARRERTEAAGLLDRARRQAQELLREATLERDRLTDEVVGARARLAAVQEEVDELRRQRDEAYGLLRRLTEQISQALDAVDAVVPDEQLVPIGRGDRIIFDGNVAQLT
jgi:cell division septum initiation protein DivIVA